MTHEIFKILNYWNWKKATEPFRKLLCVVKLELDLRSLDGSLVLFCFIDKLDQTDFSLLVQCILYGHSVIFFFKAGGLL